MVRSELMDWIWGSAVLLVVAAVIWGELKGRGWKM